MAEIRITKEGKIIGEVSEQVRDQVEAIAKIMKDNEGKVNVIKRRVGNGNNERPNGEGGGSGDTSGNS